MRSTSRASPYHGFQFIEVTGYPGVPEIEAIEGRFAHVSARPKRTF